MIIRYLFCAPKFISDMKNIKLLFLIFFVISCDVETNDEPIIEPKPEWTFVACEGNYGSSNGSISMINNDGVYKEVKDVGDVVNSLTVYKNKLIVLVNNSHKMLIYDIYEDGLRMPGIEIDTKSSGPRQMVIVDEKIYFTNWNSSDVKIFNLQNYVIEDSIQLSGNPESIAYHDGNLLVAIQSNDDYTDSNKLHVIDPINKEVKETLEVGFGPTDIEIRGKSIYLANTYYDASYNAFYGSTELDLATKQVTINNYGAGTVCGGDVLTLNQEIYRSFSGGIAKIDENLEILPETKIGDFPPAQLYSTEFNDEKVYFGLTNYTDVNVVKIYDTNNNELASFDVGIIPGDFAFWKAE